MYNWLPSQYTCTCTYRSNQTIKVISQYKQCNYQYNHKCVKCTIDCWILLLLREWELTSLLLEHSWWVQSPSFADLCHCSQSIPVHTRDKWLNHHYRTVLTHLNRLSILPHLKDMHSGEKIIKYITFQQYSPPSPAICMASVLIFPTQHCCRLIITCILFVAVRHTYGDRKCSAEVRGAQSSKIAI